MQRKSAPRQTSIASAQSSPPAAPELTASDLQTLLALARAGTLAQAAERLAADASTVFRAVQRIEKRLGLRLFERSREGYRPSEQMQEIAVHAERIEAELEAARAVAAHPSGEVSGRVRLTTVDAVLRGLVMPVLAALAQQHPRLQLELRTTNELLSLTKRDADLALRALAPGSKPPGHLVGRHLGDIRFVVCAARSMTVARRKRPLGEQDWIAPDDALPDHPSVRWRKRALPKVAPRHFVDGITAVVDGVRSGIGVGVVPLFMLPHERELVPLGDVLDGCESQLWLLAHPESRHLRRIAAVYQHLAETLRLPDKLPA